MNLVPWRRATLSVLHPASVGRFRSALPDLPGNMTAVSGKGKRKGRGHRSESTIGAAAKDA